MKALVVYDSYFGNTEKCAQAIQEALATGAGEGGQVDIVKAADFAPSQLAGLDLLVVGSPTRAFRHSPAIAKMLGQIPPKALSGIKTAAFDTRMRIEDAPGFLKVMIGIFGYAAEKIARKLAGKGGIQAVAPDWFYVVESEGPLSDGETERARAWATRVMAS